MGGRVPIIANVLAEVFLNTHEQRLLIGTAGKRRARH